MDAKKVKIEDLFNTARLFEIPFYQRSYVWKEEQWARMLQDLSYVSMTQRPYFLGAIILKHEELPLTHIASDKRIIVDGQQRLTTLVLFFKAYCLLSKSNDMFDKTFRLKDGSMALELGLNDGGDFSEVMDYDKTDLLPAISAVSRIKPAFNYFLNNIDIEKVNYNTILKCIQFVDINLENGDEEQQVFDTINSLGVRLTTSELLKNYFYSKEDLKAYKEGWVKVFEKDDLTKNYWNKEIETGRIKRSMIDIFFDAYFQLFILDSKYKVSMGDKVMFSRVERLAQSYQEFIKNYCDGDKQIILQDLAEYANRFRNLFNPDILNHSISKEYGIDRLNVVIFGLKNTTIIPYVLFVDANVENHEKRQNIYGMLESYIMRRMITRETTKNYNNFFDALILNRVLTPSGLLETMKRGSDATTFVPSDSILKQGFDESRLSNLQAKGVIYLIESALRSEKDSLKLRGFNQYSLEHLMPKKWRNHWGIPDDPLSKARDTKLQTMGNLAIITQALNGSISDAQWAIKKHGKGNSSGLETYAAGLLTMENVLSLDVWDVDNISARSNWLWEKAKCIWGSVSEAAVETFSPTLLGSSASFKELKRRYWSYALPIIQEKNNYWGCFANCIPGVYDTTIGYFGIGGVCIRCVANSNSTYVSFSMENKDQAVNRKNFDTLFDHKIEIEQSVSAPLQWHNGDDSVSSFIYCSEPSLRINNEEDWPKLADFHATISRKMLDAILPILLPKYGLSTDIQPKAALIRAWAETQPEIRLKGSKCTPKYTRFNTAQMSSILPDIKGVMSSWNTEEHYFYEIWNDGRKCYFQLSINSKGIPQEYRSVCDTINQLYPSKNSASEDWTYRIPYKGGKIQLAEGVSKEDLFNELDKEFINLKHFEVELMQELANQ